VPAWGGGTTTASTASTSPLAVSTSSAAVSSSAPATGPEVDRVGGLGGAGQRAQAHPDRLGQLGHLEPASRQASAARVASAFEVPTTATRRPAGSGW
jgi:hypothetical protein